MDKIINDNGESPDHLVKILQDIQSELGYVPMEAQKMAADRLGVPATRIYGIVSFYNFFRLFPPGRHSINICLGTACYVKGAKDILKEVETEYGVKPGQTSDDRRFSLEVVRCLGCCAIGPVITVNGKVYGRMKTAKVKEVLGKYN
jgi:NADH-quinone oxidoreductase subunit E